jgi:hypothetical protein
MLCLFNANKFYSADNAKLKAHHRKITESLQSHLESKYQESGSRIISIFQILSVVNTIDAKTVEKLFFNILVDFIKIDNVLPYIISLNGSPKDYKENIKTENDIDLNNEPSFMSKNSDEGRFYGEF